MSDHPQINPSIAVVSGRGKDAVPYFEATWHYREVDGRRRSAKQRIGRAWLSPDGVDAKGRTAWKRRRGRVPEDHFDLKRAHAKLPEIVAAWEGRRNAEAAAEVEAGAVTFRALAHEWLG